MTVDLMPVIFDGTNYDWMEQAETDEVSMNLSNGNAYALMDALGLDGYSEFPLAVPLVTMAEKFEAVVTQSLPGVNHYKDRLTRLILWSQRHGATHISFA